MKKALLLSIAALSATLSFADYRAVIFKNNVPVSQTKVSNIKSYTANGVALLQNGDESSKLFAFSDMDSLVFFSDTVYVNYVGESVVVKNPLAGLGVSVVADGANVSVKTDTTVFDMKDVVFALSGTSANGSFRMEQLKRTSLLLNNLNLTSSSAAAVALVGNKGVKLELVGENSLTGGNVCTSFDILPVGDTMSAVLYVNDKLDVAGSGSLVVSGPCKQGVFVKDDLTVSGGIVASSARKVAFRVKDNFSVEGGTVIANSSEGSCINVNDTVYVRAGALSANVVADDEKAIASDGGYVQTGGIVNVSVAGNGAKGVKVGSYESETGVVTPNSISITGGSLTVDIKEVDKFVDASGEESSAAGLKADGTISISGNALVNVTAPVASVGVKGVSADGDITVSGASKVNVSILSESGKSWCYKTDGTIYVNLSCVTTVCNEDNPKYDSDKAGTYKGASFKTINY